MKMILQEPIELTSKKGEKWVIYNVYAPSGEKVIQVFLTPKQVEDYELADAPMVKTEELKEFLAQTAPVEVEFNERGRVESVSLSK